MPPSSSRKKLIDSPSFLDFLKSLSTSLLLAVLYEEAANKKRSSAASRHLANSGLQGKEDLMSFKVALIKLHKSLHLVNSLYIIRSKVQYLWGRHGFDMGDETFRSMQGRSRSSLKTSILVVGNNDNFAMAA